MIYQRLNSQQHLKMNTGFGGMWPLSSTSGTQAGEERAMEYSTILKPPLLPYACTVLPWPLSLPAAVGASSTEMEWEESSHGWKGLVFKARPNFPLVAAAAAEVSVHRPRALRGGCLTHAGDICSGTQYSCGTSPWHRVWGLLNIQYIKSCPEAPLCL